MDRAEMAEIDLARLSPAVAEQKREAFAQAQPRVRLCLVERTFGLAHSAHQVIARLMNCHPAVDERVVPVKQDCPWRPRPVQRVRRPVNREGRSVRLVATGHAAAAACRRYASRSLRLSGPGVPSATGAPSIRTTGRRSAVVLVRNASRAVFASAAVNGRSTRR